MKNYHQMNRTILIMLASLLLFLVGCTDDEGNSSQPSSHSHQTNAGSNTKTKETSKNTEANFASKSTLAKGSISRDNADQPKRPSRPQRPGQIKTIEKKTNPKQQNQQGQEGLPRGFTGVKPNDPLGGKTPESPFDKIKTPQIPIELQVPGMPKDVVKVLDDSQFRLLAEGRFIMSRVGGKFQIRSTVNNKLLPGQFFHHLRGFSRSGQFVVGDVEYVFQVTAQGPKRIIRFKPSPRREVDQDGVRNIKLPGAVNRAVISPKDNFIVIDDGISDPMVVSPRSRTVVQRLLKARFPVYFTENEKRLYAFGLGGELLTYDWDGGKFQPMVKERLLPRTSPSITNIA